MTTGLVTQPTTLNEMYLLANQWLKTTGTTQLGLASAFVTKLDMPDIAQTPGKGCGHSCSLKSEKKIDDCLSDEKPKPKRDMSKVIFLN
jgi:hypothetical protein